LGGGPHNKNHGTPNTEHRTRRWLGQAGAGRGRAFQNAALRSQRAPTPALTPHAQLVADDVGVGVVEAQARYQRPPPEAVAEWFLQIRPAFAKATAGQARSSVLTPSSDANVPASVHADPYTRIRTQRVPTPAARGGHRTPPPNPTRSSVQLRHPSRCRAIDTGSELRAERLSQNARVRQNNPERRNPRRPARTDARNTQSRPPPSPKPRREAPFRTPNPKPRREAPLRTKKKSRENHGSESLSEVRAQAK